MVFGLFDRTIPQPRATAGEKDSLIPSVFTMLSTLVEIQDEQWTEYAFMRETIRDRLSSEQKKQLMRKAVDCGVSAADQIIWKLGEVTPTELAGRLGVKVQNSKAETDAVNRNLLAIYREPDEITVYMNGVEEATQLFQQKECPASLRGADIYAIILAHELFHVLEYRYRNDLWCCNYRMQLWKFGPLCYRTGLNVLPEISAMAFAKRLNHLPCIPYFVEVAVLYEKSPSDSCSLYRMMMDNCDCDNTSPELFA